MSYNKVFDFSINQLNNNYMLPNIVTFSKENEAIKQEGISPDSILYCGLMSSIDLDSLGISYESFAKQISNAKENEDYVIVYKEVK